MNKSKRKYSSAAEDYFQTVIKKSWTWEKLTEQEKQRFIDKNDFDVICGNDKQRVEWLNSMYHAFLVGCGYEPLHWRENETETNENKISTEKIVRVDVVDSDYESEGERIQHTFYLVNPDTDLLDKLQEMISRFRFDDDYTGPRMEYPDIIRFIEDNFKRVNIQTVEIEY